VSALTDGFWRDREAGNDVLRVLRVKVQRLHVADLDAVEDDLAADTETRHRILEDHRQMRIGILAGAAREPVDEHESRTRAR